MLMALRGRINSRLYLPAIMLLFYLHLRMLVIFLLLMLRITWLSKILRLLIKYVVIILLSPFFFLFSFRALYYGFELVKHSVSVDNPDPFFEEHF